MEAGRVIANKEDDMPVFNNRTPQYAEQVEGGIGRMQRDRLLEGDQLGGICSYVAQISLEPGCSASTNT